MPKKNFGAIAFTDSVQEQQKKHGSFAQYKRMVEQGPDTNVLGPYERQFIEARDGFYMSTVSETGWPYIQFRGGPEGFLHVLDERTIAFADFRGNRQYISVGNLAKNDKAALFLMDYENQARLKVLGRAEVIEGPDPLLDKLTMQRYPAKVERAILIHIEAFDWNCQQHIPRRFTEKRAKQKA